MVIPGRGYASGSGVAGAGGPLGHLVSSTENRSPDLGTPQMTTPRSSGEWSLAVRQQAAVAELGQVGLRGVDLEALLGEAMRAVSDTLDVDHVALFELLPDGQTLQGRAAVYDQQQVVREGVELLRLPTGRESMPGYAIHEGQAVAADDLLGDPRFRSRARDFGISARAAITAPIGWGDHYWGVLGAYDVAVRSWTDDEVHFVQSIANTVGLAISRQVVEDELRDSSMRLDLSLAAGGLGALSWDIEVGRVHLSASAERIFGLPLGGPELDSAGFLALVHPEDRLKLQSDVRNPVPMATEQHNTFRIVRPDSGETRWIEVFGRLIEDRGRASRLEGVAGDITDRRAIEDQKSALLAAEQAARVEAEQMGALLAALSEASVRFSHSLDPDVILASLADFCVPLLADLCRVDTIDDHDRVVHVVTRGKDPSGAAALDALRSYSADQTEEGGLWNERDVARQTKTVTLAGLDDAAYQRGARDPVRLELLRALAPTHVLAVPLVARGHVLGVVTLVDTGISPDRAPDHVELVEELASRAALALDNGLLYESRLRIMRSLQAALVPPALPDAPGLCFAARYRVAEPAIEIGGDFYDVIELGDGAWGVVVGDVCGRGPDAAALTGLVRHTVRTAVVRARRPSRVLAQTNDAVLSQIDDSSFCTAAYLRVEVGENADSPVRVTAACAGHPRPVVVRADGHTEFLACGGLLLGVVASLDLVEVELLLGPDDAVVLYTDGITEARNGGDLFGDDRLLAALKGLAGLPASAIADGLLAAVHAYQSVDDDDVAIVVVQASPRGVSTA